ncbi:alpha/beta hydrolase [Uliginosibacterium gangwonense]|uniref:alpha/beta hydrolase n=1 Tax=Uliginosibacterium gangwonense TaxID=392736 RepID=UPI000374B768|nr:alpha/beta hydrolase [Uliginosibacterium gangwonense]
MRVLRLCCLCWLIGVNAALADVVERVVDVPTRPGVSQRMLVMAPEHPRAAVVLFSGGDGGLRIGADGSLGGGKGNFLVRSRSLFVAHDLLTVVVDAPSDRQTEPYLGGFRQTPEHAEDIRGVIAWLRRQGAWPVWLIGTSRGTQSAAYVATTLQGADGPDGLVLTSTILSDKKSRPVTAMPLESLQIPVLAVHHEQDACRVCPPSDLPRLMEKLSHAKRKQLLSFSGGEDRGDPCEAFAHHGYNGIEQAVVDGITAWILATP